MIVEMKRRTYQLKAKQDHEASHIRRLFSDTVENMEKRSASDSCTCLRAEEVVSQDQKESQKYANNTTSRCLLVIVSKVTLFCLKR